MAPGRQAPPKAHCFVFSVPKDAAVDDIIDAIEEIVGPRGLESLQHQGNYKFCASVKTASAAARLSERGAFTVNGVSCTVACVGPQVLYVTVYRLKLYITDCDLEAALAPFGKVIAVREPTFKGRPHVGTGTRLVRMEMIKPIPNFMMVKGCRVQCEYKGVKRVCSRCGREGHHGGDCRSPWCHRCLDYGHDGAECTASCRRCGGRHASSDCLKPRSYALAAAGSFPELPPAGGMGKPGDPEMEPEFADELIIDETATPSGDPLGRDDMEIPLGESADDREEEAISSGASLSVCGTTDTNADSTNESNDEQRVNAESSLDDQTSSSSDLTTQDTEASDPEPADATRQLRARGGPLRTNTQAGKSIKNKAAKASQSTKVPKPAGPAKVSTAPKDPQLVNPISQVADLLNETKNPESLVRINHGSSLVTDSKHQKSKKLCMSEPPDKTML